MAQLRDIEQKLNKLVEEGDAEVFGAPVLSASTNGEKIIEDPTYNPARRPKAPTTPIIIKEDKKQKKQNKEAETVTLDNNLIINMDETTKTSLIAILAVLALVILCCFGCGTFVICTYSLGKAAKEVSEV